LKQNPLGLPAAWLLTLAAFVSVGLLRLPLLWALPILGFVGFGLAYRSLAKQDSALHSGSDAS
jgi:hypothetical protein